MTAALAGYVDTLALPTEPGVSPRAVRSVLKMMAKIANDEGAFRYGLRGSKVATLTDYSLSVVRRAQRYLVAHGYLERVQVGGGRASTRWRIVVHKLTVKPDSRHASDAVTTRQPARRDTAQRHKPWLSTRMNLAGPSRKLHPRVSAAEVRDAPVCEHGGDAGALPNGQLKCPICRRNGPCG